MNGKNIKDKVWKFVRFLLFDVWMWLFIIMGIFPLLRGEFIFAGILFLIAILFHWWMMSQEKEMEQWAMLRKGRPESRYEGTEETNFKELFSIKKLKQLFLIILSLFLLGALDVGLEEMLVFIPLNWGVDKYGDGTPIRESVAIIIILALGFYLLFRYSEFLKERAELESSVMKIVSEAEKEVNQLTANYKKLENQYNDKVTEHNKIMNYCNKLSKKISILE